MPDYELYQYPKSRLATFDVGKIGSKKHHIAGLLEVEVTSAFKNLLQNSLRLPAVFWRGEKAFHAKVAEETRRAQGILFLEPLSVF